MKRSEFRHGFKTEAERLSMELRAELGLSATDRLDPRVLADHLAIPVLDLRLLVKAGARVASVRHFQGVGSEVFSAVTVVEGHRRIIVVNDAHAPVRQASNVAHELSHVVLEHEPHRAVSDDGYRLWNPEMEAEANWLGGVLLVPRDGALHAAREGLTIEAVAAHFAVSEQMMRWRLTHSGAQVQVDRERAKRWGARPGEDRLIGATAHLSYGSSES
jgi:Zn-dependent peptidase ImmA (M78 family)